MTNHSWNSTGMMGKKPRFKLLRSFTQTTEKLKNAIAESGGK